MANPTSKGVGTGTAVVTDYTGLNNTTANFFKGLNATRTAEGIKREKAEARRRKAEEQLEGKLGEYDPSKVREADRELLLQKYNAIKEKYAGRYGEILQGDPALANEYNSDMAMLKNFTYNSADSKDKFQKQYDAMIAPDSGFSQDKQQQAKEYMMAEGSTLEGMKELGLFTPDTVVGDVFGKMDNLFLDSGKELYKSSEGSYINGKGQAVRYDKQNWLPDNEALPIFKTTITSNPELMQDLNIMYPEMETGEKIQKFYDDYKESREITKNDYDVGRTPSDSDAGDGGFGDKRDKFNFASRENDSSVKPFKERLEEELGERQDNESKDDYRARAKKIRNKLIKESKSLDSDLFSSEKGGVITVAKKSGSALSPVTIDGKVGVISEMKKKNNGQWVVVRNITRDDLNGNVTVTGETVTDPVDDTISAHLESEYGISNVDDFYNLLEDKKNRNTSTGGATKEKAQALIEKYKK